MRTFTTITKGIEVNGATIMSVIKGMGCFASQAKKILENNGLADVEDSTEKWYPQQKWLDAFKEISEKTGKSTLFEIGKQIPESAKFPPEVRTVEDALKSIDVAYHMNHRNTNGQPLFNPQTGTMLEGIGHYDYEENANENNKAYVTCDNPYPDDFDRGIITAIARKFSGGMVKVEVANENNSRKNGGNKTKYIVSWN
ncbi:hypothetical protein ACFL20_01645 [Spirochaetota bacterium]